MLEKPEYLTEEEFNVLIAQIEHQVLLENKGNQSLRVDHNDIGRDGKWDMIISFFLSKLSLYKSLDEKEFLRDKLLNDTELISEGQKYMELIKL